MTAVGITSTQAWQDRWRASLMDNYGTPAMTIVRGDGARVWDAEGNDYVDLLAGIAVNALGHGHPDLIAAVAEQMATVGHTSNLALTPPAVELAERLL
ncbi:MAG: aminotransferase class III-fold pyridoxal phosphate-dependent enzyme, partial [Actinomycetota bacterium]